MNEHDLIEQYSKIRQKFVEYSFRHKDDQSGSCHPATMPTYGKYYLLFDWWKISPMIKN